MYVQIYNIYVWYTNNPILVDLPITFLIVCLTILSYGSIIIFVDEIHSTHRLFSMNSGYPSSHFQLHNPHPREVQKHLAGIPEKAEISLEISPSTPGLDSWDLPGKRDATRVRSGLGPKARQHGLWVWAWPRWWNFDLSNGIKPIEMILTIDLSKHWWYWRIGDIDFINPKLELKTRDKDLTTEYVMV